MYPLARSAWLLGSPKWVEDNRHGVFRQGNLKDGVRLFVVELSKMNVKYHHTEGHIESCWHVFIDTYYNLVGAWKWSTTDSLTTRQLNHNREFFRQHTLPLSLCTHILLPKDLPRLSVTNQQDRQTAAQPMKETCSSCSVDGLPPTSRYLLILILQSKSIADVEMPKYIQPS